MALAIITLETFTESLTRHFPGCIQRTGSSINGEVIVVAVWEFRLHGSVTTRKVAPLDKVGEIALSFWQRGEGRGSKTLKIKTLTTTEPKEMEEFVSWCEEWVMGVMHALSVAFEPLLDTDPEIKPGLSGLLEYSNDKQS